MTCSETIDLFKSLGFVMREGTGHKNDLTVRFYYDGFVVWGRPFMGLDNYKLGGKYKDFTEDDVRQGLAKELL